PKNFDRRSDIQYKMTSTGSYADGTSDDSSVINSYKFKSEDKITIGACVLKVVYGETESMDPRTGKTGGRVFQLYFPELKLTAADSKEPVIIDDLKTSFAPIAPLAGESAWNECSKAPTKNCLINEALLALQGADDSSARAMIGLAQAKA